MFGSLTLADLQLQKNSSLVIEVGMDRAFDAINTTLDIHNRMVGEMVDGLMDRTTEEAERFGGVDTMVMEELDEEGLPRAQKITAGNLVGFPFKGYGAALQWSEMWFKLHTVAELAANVNAMMDADVRNLMYEMKKALFLPSNYTFRDRFVRNIDIGVKRLVNADSDPLPVGPNAEVFDGSTHTHYLAKAGSTVAATDVDALLLTVKQHYRTGTIQLWINQSEEAAMRGFTAAGQFIGVVDSRIRQGITSDTVINRPALDPVNLYDRYIGLYNGADVFVKPWIPAGYMVAINTADAKPLAYRTVAAYNDALGLYWANNNTTRSASSILEANAYRRFFGIGVRNRICAAVLDTSHQTNYAAPTLAA